MVLNIQGYLRCISFSISTFQIYLWANHSKNPHL